MIRIARGEEPEALRNERRRRRAHCRLIELRVREGEMKLDEGYHAAADALRRAQGPVCAYCEGNIRESGEPLDHFRPKAAVHDRGRKRVHGGYWWLTWSWENLFRACGTCNDQDHKANLFPLHDETARLPPMQAPPGDERPLLIDPTREDPMDLIEYRLVGQNLDGEAQWRPVARRDLPKVDAHRARVTIQTFGLDRGDILALYNERIGDFSRGVRAVTDAMRRGDREAVENEWKELTAQAFRSSAARFKALAWDYLRHTFDDVTRARWNLDLPRPGATLGRHASIDAPRLDGLDEVTCLHVEALGQSSPDVAVIRELLVQVVRVSPRRSAELAAFFSRAEATIADHLIELRSAQRVECVGNLWRATSVASTVG